MATYPKLVNKQFNSPIKLYSPQNVQETLNKQTQLLANGAVGIDFMHNKNVDKPGNLANSAVLRMLEEEEERQRKGQPPSLKRVAWPPPAEPDHQSGTPILEQEPVFAQGGPQYHTTTSPNPLSRTGQIDSRPQVQPVAHQGSKSPVRPAPLKPFQPQSPLPVAASSPVLSHPSPILRQQSQGAASPGVRNQSPRPFSPAGTVGTPTRVVKPLSPRGWAPVQPPVFTTKPNQQQYQAPQPNQVTVPVQAQTQPPNYSTSPQQQQYQPQPTQAFRPVAASAQPPPPSTIQLRQEVPVTQQPNPVFPSQPATATLQGGTNMRGDQKWPPAEVKAAVAAENEARMQLAKGPACRPRKVKKDYSQFFAQHALNATYPGYRAPPGTQHYEDNSGMSSL
ncbi:vegetative cell wall protein gp1-like [Ctenocephalides felis]|uniref:vegetative cell wall protein gp1-like n=1 Tax=Ctenocephalides felis TaxID=7515 RepID=UPI000E6E3B06|nr:vegetative cell wall protein gp1-like [Ctenocephalides felis]